MIKVQDNQGFKYMLTFAAFLLLSSFFFHLFLGNSKIGHDFTNLGPILFSFRVLGQCIMRENIFMNYETAAVSMVNSVIGISLGIAFLHPI